MENKIPMLVLVLVIGLGLGYLWGSTQSPDFRGDTHMMSDGKMMHDGEMDMEDAMDGMMSGLDGLRGDTFDKAFLTQMIMHHEGAVAMAELAQKHAKHEEIKTMANKIIADQTNEIEQMSIWWKNWYNSAY